MLIESRSCAAPDGVRLVYSAAGAGEPVLVFIHGGLANRSFWDAQLRAFAVRHRVLALDLAGHGESGSDRTRWGIPEFGADVRAVIEADDAGPDGAGPSAPPPVILFGNSLGGPVAIEAALLLGARVLGVVGIDTFQRLDHAMTHDEARERADAFRADLAGGVRAMTRVLFHADADPALVADAERRMAATPAGAVRPMFLSLGGYDPAAAARRLSVPLRAINGDLFPADVAAVRAIVPGFDAVVMNHMGHYPMLERPEEFNRLVAGVIAELDRRRRS